MSLLGGIIGEINADWQSGNAFMSRESLEPVLALDRAENRIEEIEVDEEVMASAKVIMAIALDGFAKAAWGARGDGEISCGHALRKNSRARHSDRHRRPSYTTKRDATSGQPSTPLMHHKMRRN